MIAYKYNNLQAEKKNVYDFLDKDRFFSFQSEDFGGVEKIFNSKTPYVTFSSRDAETFLAPKHPLTETKSDFKVWDNSMAICAVLTLLGTLVAVLVNYL